MDWGRFMDIREVLPDDLSILFLRFFRGKKEKGKAKRRRTFNPLFEIH